MPGIETAEYYNKEAAKRIAKYFQDCGLKTRAGMLGAYDQWRHSEQYYYQITLEVSDEIMKEIG